MTGIYQITNKVNGRRYIGQSINITSRWDDHLHYLLRNKHCNKCMQNDFNKYGYSGFSFDIVTVCRLIELNDVEMEYINKLNKHDYNVIGSKLGEEPYNAISIDSRSAKARAMDLLIESKYDLDFKGKRRRMLAVDILNELSGYELVENMKLLTSSLKRLNVEKQKGSSNKMYYMLPEMITEKQYDNVSIEDVVKEYEEYEKMHEMLDTVDKLKVKSIINSRQTYAQTKIEDATSLATVSSSI